MKRKLIAVVVANLFAGSAAVCAQETGLKWTGDVSVGLRVVKDHTADPSKFREYRDVDSMAITALDIQGQSDSHRVNIFGENLGQDDQYIDIRGTRFGAWKFRFYDNEVRHRFGSGPGARSPYSGIGSSVLTATLPRPNPNNWLTFDDSLKRRDIGGMAEWSAHSPWYFRVDGNDVRRNGIKVIAGSGGTSPGNGAYDLPSPVDWKTRNIAGEVGYQAPNRHFAVSYLYSKFENDNDVLRWSNNFFAPGAPLTRDTSVLPADNSLWRIGANGSWRGLPWGSTLAGRITYSKLTSDVGIQPTMLAAGATNPATAPNVPVFNGEIVTTTGSVAFNSHPMRALDTKVYYNFRQKDNNSTQLVFTPTPASGLQCGGGPCVPELFDYEKHNIGAEAFYRVNRANRLGLGYDYYHTSRNRADLPKTIDQKIFAEWKNSSFDTIDGRLRYQYLHRSSVIFPFADPGNPVDAYVRRFDFSNVNQHQVKLGLNANPMPLLDLGLDVILKYNDFRDTPLGRTDDKRHEYYASVGYGDAKKFRVFLFADIEFFEADSRHRVGGGNPNPDAPPAPAAPAVSTTYTWTADTDDKSWQTGVAFDWLPWERLKVHGSLTWGKTTGSVDFATQAGTVLAASLLPINNYDNTRRIALNLNSTYRYDRQWRFTGGYAFESYKYSDIALDNYYYTVGAAPTTRSYFTGQGAFQPYNAHIFYTYATYSF